MPSKQMIFEQTSKGLGRNHLSEMAGKRISGRGKIKIKELKVGKSLLIQRFLGRPKGHGVVGQRYVGEVGSHRQCLDF